MKKWFIRFNQVIALFVGLLATFLLIQWLVAPIYQIALSYSYSLIVNVELVHLIMLYFLNKAIDRQDGRIISQRFHLGRYVYLSLVLQAMILFIYYIIDVCWLESEFYFWNQKVSVLVLSCFGIYYLGKWYLKITFYFGRIKRSLIRKERKRLVY